MTLHAPQTRDVIDDIARRLGDQHLGTFDDVTVRGVVLDSFRRYRHLDHPSSHARALAAQLSADRLEAMHWVTRPATACHLPSFLFVCSGNAGRSQLAAAVMRATVPASTRVVSAGDHPAARILPSVIESLDEIGIPVFGEYPKPLTPEFVSAADEIIVLNSDDTLDELDGRQVRRWTFVSDSSSGRQGLRQARSQIVDAVRELVHEHRPANRDS